MPPTTNPWKEFYAQRGEARPTLGHVPPAAGVQHPPPGGPSEPPVVWEEKVEAEIVTVEEERQRMASARRRRWQEMVVFGELLLGTLLVVLLLTGSVEFYRWWRDNEPPEGQLNARTGLLAAEALRRTSTPQMPLMLDSVRAVLRRQPDAEHAEYEVVIVLRLRSDLFAPADSNGAQPYLQLQQSLAEARAEAVRQYARLAGAGIPPRPEMPLLLERTARAGGRTTVRIPLRAERIGWHWLLEVPAGANWTPDRPLPGQLRASYPRDALVFGQPGDREVIRRRQEEARDYILAVRRALAAP